jgi:type VI secretion system protein ImpB
MGDRRRPGHRRSVVYWENHMASIHDKLERVRKPRVHITYQVETEGAQIERELPFVVGVMGDFSGDPTEPLKPLKERKFIQIDRDNFNDVMARLTPGLNLKVENTLAGDGSQMAVALKFRSLDDFEPAAVVNQVPALKKLQDTRNQLRDLMTKVDRSEDLEKVLERVLQNSEELKQMNSALAGDAPAGDSGSKEG